MTSLSPKHPGIPLDMRLHRYFAVVVEENNLRRAAERLFICQPPLSRKMKQMEDRLGVTLFVRHNKGLELIDDGRRVYK